MPTAPVLPRPDTSGVSEAWLRGIPHDPNDADWSSYDSDIANITKAYNDHLSGQSGFFPLAPTFVKAMCWTESGAAAPEWTSRPMQIGNTGDTGLQQLLKINEQNRLILPPEFYKGGKFALTAASVRTMPIPNIRAGIGYLLLRSSKLVQVYVPADKGKTFTDTVGKGGSLFALAGRDHTTVSELQQTNAAILKKPLQPNTVLSFRHMDLQSSLTFKLITPYQAASTYNNANVEEYTQKINYCLWVLNGGAVAADAAGKAGSK